MEHDVLSNKINITHWFVHHSHVNVRIPTKPNYSTDVHRHGSWYLESMPLPTPGTLNGVHAGDPRLWLRGSIKNID